MAFAISADGTRIAYETHGSGPTRLTRAGQEHDPGPALYAPVIKDFLAS